MHRILFAFSLLFPALVLVGCGGGGTTTPSPPLHAAPLNEQRDGGATLFTRMEAAETGIDFVHRWDPPEELSEMITGQNAGGGVCIGDVDGDELPDLFLSRPQGGCRLYRNLGDFRFEDMTRRAGIDTGTAWALGPTFADIDNDGDLDLYLCVFHGPNQLYLNRGDGRFDERAKAFGIDYSGASVMMSFADYDRDGDLDGYLLTNRDLHPKGLKPFFETRPDGSTFVPEPFREFFDVIRRPDGTLEEIAAGQADRLYRNDGDTFTELSTHAGITGYHYGLSATWWDADTDGWPDLYVANDFHGPDQLYRNRRDGTFENIAARALPHTPWYSMGSDYADIDNDGLLDFVASDMQGTTHFDRKVMMGDMDESGWFLEYGEPRQAMRNAVYLNTGTDRFMEVAQLTGLDASGWTWSTKWGDFDNDGREDLFISNGMTRRWFDSDLRDRLGGRWDAEARRIWREAGRQDEANQVYRNLGDLRFEERGAAWGLDAVSVGFGAALGDLDRDGDLDLVVNHFEEPPGVFRNGGTRGHRVSLRLVGQASNRYGIGARVKAVTGDRIRVRYLGLARGFMAANEPLVHIGLGEDERIDLLEITWPSGRVQRFEQLAADRHYTLREAGSSPEPEPALEPEPPPLFSRYEGLAGLRHREKPYDDYLRQPLLPQKLSQLGPGMAAGDIDRDGDEDLYIGGAAGIPGLFLINEGTGDWRARPRTAHAACEEMMPLFFDADGDGDEDLYTVSGGVECEPGDELLRDHLYLNDGKGTFHDASERLPDLRDSGGPVAAADFDRDGDLDLFIGGRVIPGRWPLSPNSRLLRNDGGRFTEVTENAAPGLRQSGLVTSALWSDADGDGWIDLLVAQEWGPLRYWRNEAGRLSDASKQAGLSDRPGQWNSLAAGDLDNDGDLDYLAGNLGLNTKYHASPDHPQVLYYGDFEGKGVYRCIEAKFDRDVLRPERGYSCSRDANPFITETITSYRDFAQSSLVEVYPSDHLAKARKFEATELRSGAWLNDGKGHFSFHALPRLAQVAPVFGIALLDANRDGNIDALLAQNAHAPQRETGRMSGGVSLLLVGDGSGGFRAMRPDRSGIVVPGDAKSLVTTDLNGDGNPDLLFGVNQGPFAAFVSSPTNRFVPVRVRGAGRVGARLTIQYADGTTQVQELQAGSGYLSHSSEGTGYVRSAHGGATRIQLRRAGGGEPETRELEGTESSLVFD